MNLLYLAAATGLGLSGARLRRRLEAIEVLDETPSPVAPDPSEYRLVTARGVSVPTVTESAARRMATDQKVDVLDLVPGDLPGDRLMEFLRSCDTTTYPGDSIAPGRTAGHAMLVNEDVLRRAESDAHTDLTTAEMMEFALFAKQFAPRSTSVAIAPSLRSAPISGNRWELLEQLFGGAAGNTLLLRFLSMVWLVVGAARGRRSAAWALAAYQLQPSLVSARTAVRPRDRWASPLTRGVGRFRDLLRTTRERRTSTRAAEDEVESRRAAYPELADGPGQLLEPRRDDCPLCGSTALRHHTTTPDFYQGKPGSFDLDICGDCDLLFQNPRLTVDGLDYYYRDFYDGLSAQRMAATFSGGRGSYQGRVDIIGAVTSPRRLLDVGTGQGHFCLVAHDAWPDAVIDGLDFTENVTFAEKRGWIDHGFNGLFPKLAPQLEDSYDVVTMHHYLEHVREPGEELDAAARVLEPGGYLEIEVPNPQSRIGRLLGRYWMPLLQPQHQHLLPLDLLTSMLTERGFRIVKTEVSEAHQPVDFGGAAYLLFNELSPGAHVPWQPRPTWLQRSSRLVVTTALFPGVVAAYFLDQALAPVMSTRGSSSAYRVIAQIEPTTTD